MSDESEKKETAKTKTGHLTMLGPGKLGDTTYNYFRCDDCGGDYPVIDGRIKCNGHAITLCPWCRPDSEPFKNGRGS